jgi:hypothetical protein
MVNASKPLFDPATDLHRGMEDLFPICPVKLNQHICDKVSA